MCLIDDNIRIAGSMNWSNAGLHKNNESEDVNYRQAPGETAGHDKEKAGWLKCWGKSEPYNS